MTNYRLTPSNAAKDSKMTPTAFTDRLLGYMLIIVHDDGINDWERKFCASMIAKQRRGVFRPSINQVATMDRIVNAFLKRSRDADVIEDPGMARHEISRT